MEIPDPKFGVGQYVIADGRRVRITARRYTEWGWTYDLDMYQGERWNESLLEAAQ